MKHVFCRVRLFAFLIPIFAVILFFGANEDLFANTSAFSENLIVCRVGDGSLPLGNGATAVFLDEYTPAGVFVRSIPLPTLVSGLNRRLTVSGSSVSECQITRSVDGRFVVVAGYDAAVGTLSLAASEGTTNPRVIGRLDAMGNVDTSTALVDAISEGSVRGAASTDGTDLWISGNGTGANVSGVRYAVRGASSSVPLMGTAANLRAVNIFGEQLYVSANAGQVRMAAVGFGTPAITGQALRALAGIPSTVSIASFYFADLSEAVPGVDTLYAADDSGDVIRKYSFNGSSWAAKGTVAMTDVTGLTGVTNGSEVRLYAANAVSLQTITDISGYNAVITGALFPIAAPPQRTEFRSVAFAPVSPAAVLDVTWGTRAFTRMATLSAANGTSGVKRIYFKLPFAADFQFVDASTARIKVVRANGGWSFQAFTEDSSGIRSNVATFSVEN